MRCPGCGFPVERGRAKVGLATCRTCGDREAARAIEVKRNQVGPAGNKLGYQYLGGSSIRQNLLDAGRKTSADDPADHPGLVRAEKRLAAVRARGRRRLGIAVLKDGDRRIVFDGDDWSSWNPETVVWFDGVKRG